VGDGLAQVARVLERYGLQTICVEARCPNRSVCWSERTATFLILGPICTRNCRYCSVAHGRPAPLEQTEPERLAAAAAALQLKHVVITSVTRDDLPDGGAEQFARCIRAVRNSLPSATIEVLTSDFAGRLESVRLVCDAGPDVFNHNIEVVRQLFASMRPQGDYERSLRVLEFVRSYSPKTYTKSGLMVGFGETAHQLCETLTELRNVGCEMVTIGQYLRPAPGCAPVQRYYRPEQFRRLEQRAMQMGFSAVACGPFVRSSYRAAEMLDICQRERRQ